MHILALIALHLAFVAGIALWITRALRTLDNPKQEEPR